MLRRRNGARIAAVVFMLLFAVSVWAPTASTAPAKPEKTIVETSVEAWYYVADDTVDPGALPAVPDPVNPYGENTLHVSITGGQEDSRTYIALDLADLPPTFEVVEGQLILPIDPGGVTMGADTARVQICLSDIPPKSEEGSFQPPPEVDCKTSVPATYAAKPKPHMTADITDFGPDLAFSGLAILPSDRAKEKGDTWHVTFYGKKNEAENTEPITAELQTVVVDPTAIIEVPDSDTGTTTFDTGSAGTTSSSGDFDFSSSSGPDVSVGSTDPDVTAAGEPVEVNQPVAAELPLDLAAETKPAYAIVWALPLLLLALALYFGSALTRDVVLRWDSR